MKHHMSQTIIVLVLGFTVLLAGCISLNPPKHPKQDFKTLSASERQAELAKIHRWEIEGSFSVQQTGKKPMLANYVWLQEAQTQYHIRIMSALNLFSISILGRLNSVTLWKTVKDHVTARTPEALLQKEMGWSLPIRDMFYWVRGMAAPGEKVETRNRYGHLKTLTQKGWAIKFSDYSNIKGFDLPGEMVMTYPRIRIVIVIKHWRLINYDLPLQ